MSVVAVLADAAVVVVVVVEGDEDSGRTSASAPHFDRRDRHVETGHRKSVNMCKLEFNFFWF